jgi:hypothetical protein
MKGNHNLATVEMKLQVPRGLLEFLDKMQYVTGEKAKDHLEELIRKDLESIINELSNVIFDYEFIRTRYGEGSDISGPTAAAEK